MPQRPAVGRALVPADGNPVPFEQEGDRLRVSESGTMTMHARFTGSGREPYECNAEGVRFSVRR